MRRVTLGDDRHRDLLPRLRLRLARLAGSAEAPGLRALAAAFDAGVTWFDLAPLYGGGRAEEIAGRFLKGRRARRCRSAARSGWRPRAAARGLKAALMPLARAGGAGGAGAARPAPRAGAQAAQALPLTPELLTGSIETSLRRLGTDHLDLYALHDVAGGGAEPTTRCCARSRPSSPPARRGRWRWRATPAAARAAIASRRPFGAVQAALPAPGAPTRTCPPAAAAGFGAIVHSVFGVEGSLAALRARAAADPGFRAAVTGAGRGRRGSRPGAGAAPARAGLRAQPDGRRARLDVLRREPAQNLAVADGAPAGDPGRSTGWRPPETAAG